MITKLMPNAYIETHVLQHGCVKHQKIIAFFWENNI